jgi:hypothetical protein
VIESYLTHLQLGSDRTLKSVVDPAAVESVRSAHLFNFLHRSAVDENGYPVHHNRTKAPSFERLRINHYFWKSEEELLWKARHRSTEQGSPSNRRQKVPSFEEVSALEAERGVRDEAILHYAKPVRATLRAHSAAQSRARG